MLRSRRVLLGSLAAGATLVAGALGWRVRREALVGALPPRPPPRESRNPGGPLVSGTSFDWFGILGTGQSLAVGVRGAPALSTAPAFDNLKLSLGDAAVPPFDPTSPELSLVPLREPVRPFGRRFPEAYPGNLRGETPHTAMAHQISTLSRARLARDCVTVHSVVGESGQGMAVIERDAAPRLDSGLAWAASLFEVQAIARLAKAKGKRYGVGAVLLTHGEADAERSAYGEELIRLWQDYNADLSMLTGQSQAFPMLMSQQHSVPTTAGSVSTGLLAMRRVAQQHAPFLVLSGPKYQYAYDADAVHLTALSYARLGEKYGQVFFQHVLAAKPFRPLEPVSVERSGRQLRVVMAVPVPPLRWDDSLPRPHQRGTQEWSEGRGFEVTIGQTPIRIVRVHIEEPASVVIELPPDVAPELELELRYALSAHPEPRPDGTLRWGQLQDSDPFVGSLTRTPQPNHAVAFELGVPRAPG